MTPLVGATRAAEILVESELGDLDAMLAALDRAGLLSPADRRALRWHRCTRREYEDESAFIADLATVAGREAAIGAVLEHSRGKLDGVVSCAGLAPFDEPTAVTRVNYFGAIAMLDGLRDQTGQIAGSVGRYDGIGPAIEKRAVALGYSEIMSDNEARQRPDQLLHDVAVRQSPDPFDSLANEGAGLGAMWGAETATRMLGDAGFGQVEMKSLPHDIINNYFTARK